METLGVLLSTCVSVSVCVCTCVHMRAIEPLIVYVHVSVLMSVCEGLCVCPCVGVDICD